jgi:flagellin
MAALQTLRSVNAGLEKTQQQVSSGLRVQAASDNAAYWSIATTMRSDNRALGAVSDAIGLTSAVLDTTYAAMDGIEQALSSIKALMVTASSMPEPAIGYPYSAANLDDPNVDPLYNGSQQAKVAQDIDQHFQQIRSLVRSASFNGVNLLHMDDNSGVEAKDVTNTFVTGYVGGKVLTLDLPLMDTLLINDSNMDAATFSNLDPGNQGILDASLTLNTTGPDGVTHSTGLAMFTWWSVSVLGGSTRPIEKTNDMVRTIEMYVQKYGGDRGAAWNLVIGQIDEKHKALVSAMSRVGSLQKSMELSGDFVNGQIDTVEKGIGRLVDADMEEASAKLSAQQTQQQLAIQSLQIANTSAKNIMQLFR